MSNVSSVQAHAASNPPPQTQDRVATGKADHPQPSTPPPHTVPNTHKVDIKV